MPTFCESFFGAAMIEAAAVAYPYGPGFDPGDVARAGRLERWCQGGPDDGAADIYDEWRLLAPGGEVLASRRIRF